MLALATKVISVACVCLGFEPPGVEAYIHPFGAAGFTRFCDRLALSEAQARVAQTSFDQYLHDYEALNTEIAAEMREIASDVGWAPPDYVPPGVNLPTDGAPRPKLQFRLPEQWLEIAERSSRCFEESLKESEASDNRLMAMITEMLSESQQESIGLDGSRCGRSDRSPGQCMAMPCSLIQRTGCPISMHW